MVEHVDLTTMTVVDLLVVFVCTTLVRARVTLRHTHPFVIMLAFHVLIVSARLWAIAFAGSRTSYSATASEIVFAVVVADLALVVFAAGCLVSSREVRIHDASPARRVTDESFWIVGVICVPYGLYSLATNVALPGRALNDGLGTIAYVSMTWPGLYLLISIYRHGFRPHLVLLMTGYLALMAIQGQGRFRVILPALLLAQIATDRHRRRWPRVSLLMAGIAMFLVFLPLKSAGQDFLATGDLNDAWSIIVASFGESLGTNDTDQQLLDIAAVALTSMREQSILLWGASWIPILTLLVPRSIYPSKPGLGDHILLLSSGTRPLYQDGAAISVYADIFINFGFAGIVAGFFLLSVLANRLYRAACAHGYGSAVHLFYLISLVSTVQVLRDGISSFVTFLLINQFPLLLLVILNSGVVRSRLMKRGVDGASRSGEMEPRT